MQNSGVPLSAFERLAECLSQIRFGCEHICPDRAHVRIGREQIRAGREGWQKLLDAVKSTIEIIESVFDFHWRKQVESLNKSRDPT